MPVVLRLLISLVAGILVAYHFHAAISGWILFSFVVLSWLSYLVYRNRISVFSHITGFLFTPLFFTFGIYLEQTTDSRQHASYFTHLVPEDSTGFFQLRLADYPQPADNWIKFDADVISANDSAVSGTVKIYLQRDSLSEKLAYGDLLYASTRFFAVQGPSNPHEFDYRAYLAHQDIYHQAFIRSGTWTCFGNDANPLLNLVYKTRTVCSGIIDSSGMKAENRAVAKALLLGDKEFISDELMLSYTASGTLHVLAVSGLHVGIVMLILSFLLNPLKRLKKGQLLFLVFALAGIWFYTLLTGFSPSILRAAVMFSFVLIGNELQRDTAIYQSLLVSALILIVFDPHIIFNLGFLLSYLAVFGIVFFHPKIYARYCPKYKLVDKTWQLISVSVAAQIATLPLSLYCFYQFPTYFLLANLVVIPISFLILVMGIAALVLHAVPYISTFLFYLIDLLITCMNEGVMLVEKLPAAVLQGLIIRWYDALFLFALIFSITFLLVQKSKKWLYASLAFSTLICGSLLYQKTIRETTNQAVFYQVKNQVILDVITGSSVSCFATEGSLTDEQKMRFHVYPNRIQTSGAYYAAVNTIMDSTGLLSIVSHPVLFLNQTKAETQYAEKFPAAELVYLYDASFLDKSVIGVLKEQHPFVILGSGVTYSLKRYLKKSIPFHLIHDLNEQGAAVFDLDLFANPL